MSTAVGKETVKVSLAIATDEMTVRKTTVTDANGDSFRMDCFCVASIDGDATPFSAGGKRLFSRL